MKLKSLVLITLASATLSGLVLGVLLFKPFKTNAKVLSAQTATASPDPLPSELTDLTNLTFLVLGLGGPGHEGGFLTDAIMLVNINFETKKIAFVSIPRDLWVKFPDGNSRKINAAFAYSGKISIDSRSDLEEDRALEGSELIKSLAADITSIPINYFVSIDFVGTERALGVVLGGIDVEVSKTLDDPWFPIKGNELELCDHTPEEVGELTKKYSGFALQKQFPCRYEHIHFDAGLNHMGGDDALKFVRSRHSGSDFERSKRQVEVLLAVKNKLFKVNALDDAAKFLQSVSHTVQTDLDGKIVNFLAPLIKSAGDFQVVTIHLDTTNVFKESKSNGGAFILLPKKGQGNYQQIHSLIQNQL